MKFGKQFCECDYEAVFGTVIWSDSNGVESDTNVIRIQMIMIMNFFEK